MASRGSPRVLNGVRPKKSTTEIRHRAVSSAVVRPSAFVVRGEDSMVVLFMIVTVKTGGRPG